MDASPFNGSRTKSSQDSVVGALQPVLSAIIISRGDEKTIERTVASVVGQKTAEPFEVILVASGGDRTAAIVRNRFPSVRVIDLERPALPGQARNAGLAVARGDYVSFPGSHVELPPGSLAARIAAHRKGYAMVTGSILNGTKTPAGWASYFMDHSDALPGRPSGELATPPAHCSYDRRVLAASGWFPEDMRAGEDTVVNLRLWQQGHRAYRAQDVYLCHISRCTTFWRLVRHHFVRGRAWGRILVERGTGFPELSRYVGRRLQRTMANVEAWGGDLAPEFARVRFLVRLGIVAAFLGMISEIGLRRR
ncbi:MAG TPA: glycosyltransferase family A protein [Bauldia sp.]|nr:glycosyltransferase family A protein [Bauldia sp.]